MATTTKNQYTGDGTTSLFPFTFPYIEEKDVVVSVDGVVLTFIIEYIFSNATTIGIVTPPPPGAEVLIERKTSSDTLKATFFPGSAIRARDLNDNFTQNLYVTQESVINADEATDAAEAAVIAAQSAEAAAAQAQTDATQAAQDAANAAAGIAEASQDAADAQTAAAAAQISASQAQVAASEAAADAQTALDSVADINDAVENGAVLSVNGQGGVVVLGINDLTDVQVDETPGTSHYPEDGDALVWDSTMNHWMPGAVTAPPPEVDLDFEDLGDFAYAPASNTVVWDVNTNRTDGSILDPNDWRFTVKAFVWSPYSSNHSEMMKLEVGDEIDFVLGDFSGTRTVTTAPAINAYEGPSGVNSPPTSYYIEVDIDWPANSSDELRLTSAPFVQGIEPLRTGDVLIYNVPTSKWTVSPTSKLDLNFENLSDFAYGPTSNQVELEGPLKANGSSITGEEFIAATAVLYFASTNTRVFDALATLAVDEAVTIYYYGLLGNGEERLITFNTTVRIPVAVQGDNAAIYWNFDYGGTYTNPDGSTGTVTTIPSRGPILITSPYLVNGTDALNNGDILKYNHTTGKWTASPSISISTLPLLP